MKQMTQHAERRCQQRGFPAAIVNLVIEYADREANVGDRCTALEISHEALEGLRVSSRDAERARGVVVILNDEGEVVTVLKARNSKVARVYRKGLH